MKVAYHFKVREVGEPYDRFYYRVMFSKILDLKYNFLSSKILSGDLLAHNYINSETDEKYFVFRLVQYDAPTWKGSSVANLTSVTQDRIFVICFETIQQQLASLIDSSLSDCNDYIGSFEIDDGVPLHWALYNQLISHRFRIINKRINILIDSDEDEYIDIANDFYRFFGELPFESVETEISGYRYTIADDNDNYEYAKRLSYWKKSTESIFSTITDEIISKLTDTTPNLVEKLWVIASTFDQAETNEQYSYIMLSCRNLYEYMADCLFPATKDVVDGHALTQDHYKNRIIAFVASEVKSETNRDVIVSNIELLYKEWNTIFKLQNKGVHTRITWNDCRRCLIRTLLLLDDIISIKKGPFEVNIESGKYIKKMVRGMKKKNNF